ncbi:MAG: transcriptional regulator, LacI family [Edaphobacter sp.]|nr:transcriptional regulator, LacI family [Edaphobacter sp.]
MPISKNKGAPTIGDIADLVGVSRSSVSRAFGKPELLSEDTVKKIRKAAEKLGYFPNQAARALSTGRPGNLAIVVPDIANAFSPPLIRAAQLAADSHGMSLFLGDSGEDPAREFTLLNRLVVQTEGFVLVSSRMPDKKIKEIAEKHPLVLINRDISGISRVLIDTSPGVEAAVVHLAEIKHKKIAYVGGPSVSWSEQQRRGAVRRAAEREGLTVEYVRSGHATFDAGREAASAVIAAKASAAIAFDDVVAHGLLAGLNELGYRVPQDISVIGCDDVLGAATYPALTSVSARHIEAGRMAIEMLLNMIEEPTISNVRIALDTKLVVRATTAPR